MSKNNIIVNSWNEWDPLKHVIVGKADGTCIPAPEPALDAKVPETNTIIGGFFLFISIIYYSLIMRWNKRYIALN